MRKRLVCLCVLPFLVLVACGDDDGDTSATDSTSGSTVASTTTPTSESAADLELAKKLVFLPADFPEGWTPEPEDQTEDDDATSGELNACVGASGEEAESADWDGDDFSMGTSRASASVSVVRDEATFEKDVEAIKSQKLQTCLKDIFSKELTDEIGVAPTEFEVAPLEVAEYGDVTAGYRMTVTVSARGETQTFYVDLVLMGKSRAEVNATFFGLGQPFDPALQESLIAELGARVDAA